ALVGRGFRRFDPGRGHLAALEKAIGDGAESGDDARPASASAGDDRHEALDRLSVRHRRAAELENSHGPLLPLKKKKPAGMASGGFILAPTSSTPLPAPAPPPPPAPP